MQDTVVLPNPTDQDVLDLMRIHSLSGMPEFVSFSDAGYPPRFCHVAAKHAAMTNSGKRVHGRAFWRFVRFDAIRYASTKSGDGENYVLLSPRSDLRSYLRLISVQER